MRDSATPPVGNRARLVLDCGVDEQPVGQHLTVDEKGMRFLSRWRFTLGTRLAVGCHCGDPELGGVRVALEGIVVWCERCPQSADQAPLFDTTILFLELPDDLRQSLREFSYQLGAAE